jgi:translation elongation factor P
MQGRTLPLLAFVGMASGAYLAAPSRLLGPARRVCVGSTARASTISAGTTKDFKNGLTIEFDEQVYKIIEFMHVKPGKGAAFVRSKLKNLLTGNTLEKTWRAGESFADAVVEKEELQFSYIDDRNHVFMNMESFEEESIASTQIAGAEFLKEGATITAVYWKGKAIDVRVPDMVNLVVAETVPGDKGNTAQGRTEKPCKLETGAELMIPNFINEGEEVKVDTKERKYAGRIGGGIGGGKK